MANIAVVSIIIQIVMAFLWALYLLVLSLLYQDFNQKDVDTLICIAEKAHQQNGEQKVSHSDNINHGDVAEHNKGFELEICDDEEKEIGKQTAEDCAEERDTGVGVVGNDEKVVSAVSDDDGTAGNDESAGGDGVGGDGDSNSSKHNCVNDNCTNSKSVTSDEDEVKDDKRQIDAQALEDCADVGCASAASGDGDASCVDRVVRFTDDSCVKLSDNEGCPKDESDCDGGDLKKKTLVKRVLSKLYNGKCNIKLSDTIYDHSESYLLNTSYS